MMRLISRIIIIEHKLNVKTPESVAAFVSRLLTTPFPSTTHGYHRHNNMLLLGRSSTTWWCVLCFDKEHEINTNTTVNPLLKYSIKHAKQNVLLSS